MSKRDELEIENGECYFCGVDLDETFFCYGCEEFICQYCDETEVWGQHTASEHQGELDEDF